MAAPCYPAGMIRALIIIIIIIAAAVMLPGLALADG